MRKITVVALSVAAIFILSSCAGPNPLVNTTGTYGIAGFWSGLWHGLTCGFSFIGSLFNPNIHIYEVHNNGVWYNFGFVLGVGGLSASIKIKS